MLAAIAIGVLNAVLPPIVAALRLPFMLAIGFLLVLVADALVLVLADQELSRTPSRSTRSAMRCSPRW